MTKHCGKCGKFLYQSATIVIPRVICPECGFENLFFGGAQESSDGIHGKVAGISHDNGHIQSVLA